MMNLEDAYQFIGLDPSSTESERFAAYEAMRGTLEAKLAKAPTAGLKDKYRGALAQLDEAIEAIENAVDGGDLPILQPGYADAPSHHETAHRTPASQQAPARSYSPPKTSELVVVPKSTLTKIICWPLALFCLAVAGRLFYTAFAGDGGDGFLGPLIGGVVVGFIALMFLGATMDDKKSACPECGHAFDDVQDDLTQCPSCLAYLRASESTLTTVDENEILDEPTFKAPIPDEFQWPHACCVCRAGPTRTLEFNLEKSATGRNLLIGAAGLAAGALIVARGGGHSASITAPYCDRCEDGIDLEKDGDEFKIRFRSYGYYRDFCLLNRLSPLMNANLPA